MVPDSFVHSGYSVPGQDLKRPTCLYMPEICDNPGLGERFFCQGHAIVRICAVRSTVSVVVHARAFLTLATRSCAMFTALSRYYDERHGGRIEEAADLACRLHLWIACNSSDLCCPWYSVRGCACQSISHACDPLLCYVYCLVAVLR